MKAPEMKQVVPRTQWQLVWRQFKRHRLAMIGLGTLACLYFIGFIFPEFFAPYTPFERTRLIYAPPQKVSFINESGRFGLRPFVYGYHSARDPDTWETVYTADASQRYPIRFFVRGSNYKLWGLFETNLRLFGVEQGTVFLLGTDHLGRDLLSRIIYASRISMSIGLVGVAISFVLGLVLGGISGLFGGWVDDIIQRVIETFMSVPKIPLWMALAASIPREWSAVQMYFAITIILSLMGWTGLARVVRSKFMSLREADFVMAARSFNVPETKIILHHLIPNFITYVIVSLTLAIPDMILAETALSFLGLGLRPPTVSIGVLLEQAQSFQVVSMYPWLLAPGLVVVIVVLSFNFVGDGLRDSADPYD